jgi:hypothetical protein
LPEDSVGQFEEPIISRSHTSRKILLSMDVAILSWTKGFIIFAKWADEKPDIGPF